MELSEERILTNFRRVRDDPWEFLKRARTLDQVDKKNPIKRFPIHLDYLRLYVRVWQREPLILVPKSRRMKMSWINIGLYTWDTAFNIGRNNAFVSKKEDDSDELVQRSLFILENFDYSDFSRDLMPKWEYVKNRLRFPETYSKIEGYPSGANQLRQFTFSGIFADELAFWDDAEEMYAAAYPTIEGGGRFTGVSSAAPGFFGRMVHDKIDHKKRQ